MEQAKYALTGHPLAMLTEVYSEALSVDEEVADQVCEDWDAGEFDDQVAWRLITSSNLANPLLQLGYIRIKPNPPKYGDGKLRALASSEKP